MLRQYPGILRKLVWLADLLTAVLSFLAAYYLRLLLFPVIRYLYPQGRETELTDYRLLVALVAVVWGVLLLRLGQYVALRYTSLWAEYRAVGQITILGGLLLAATAFLLKVPLPPRTLFAIFLVVNFVALAAERTLLHFFLHWLHRHGQDRKSVLVVGGGLRAQRFLQASSDQGDLGLDVAGFIDVGPDRLAEGFDRTKYLGADDDLRDVLHRHPVDEVLVALPVDAIVKVRSVLAVCEEEGVQARVLGDLFGTNGTRMRADHVRGIPVLTFYTVPTQEWQLLAKRLIDIVISALLLVLLAPLFAVIAVAIKLTSPGPVFYEWKVMGLNKQPFTSWKFRTMVPNADALKAQLMARNEMSGPVFKIKNDPRITPVGRILRKLSLDELPQFYSVLKGDMSVVGPRPPLVTEVYRFENWHRRKLSMRPGITCLWQVSGRSGITDFDDWARLDLEYIDNWSLALDFKIMLKTVPAVLFGRGAH